MGELGTATFRSELLDRKTRLESARASRTAPPEIEHLLTQVDAALERIDHGTFGLCLVCKDPIEPDRLASDPLVDVCLDHLNALERRALEADLQLALRVQKQLLPAPSLHHGGWTAHYHYVPAGVVGGDFCDLAIAGPECLFFAVGDVAGKGVAASLLMSHIHATFRTLLSMSTPIEEMLVRANRLFCASTMPSHYATVACGFAHASGDLQIANAGHCPPVVVRSSTVEAVEEAGLPLGMFCEGKYTASRLRLDAGDSLLLYTDGLTEARSASDEEFGFDRVRTTLARATERSAEKLTSSCVESLGAFLAGAPNADDLTLMVIRRGEA